MIAYSNVLYNEPDNGATYTDIAPGGAHADAEATSCTGTPSTFQTGGTGYVTNVYNATNALGHLNYSLNEVAQYVDSSNPTYLKPYDYIFIDNAADMYGVSPQPCNYSQSTWASATGSVLGQLSQGPFIINALSESTMSAEQMQMAAVNSPSVAMAMFEGCYGSHDWDSSVPGDYISGVDKDWLEAEYGEIHTVALGKTFWCYSKNTGDASSLLSNRMYIYASFLLSYDPNHAVFETADATTSTFSVMPETGLVPMYPKTTASDVSGYALAGGAYAREFGQCYYRGSAIGACAVVVNPGLTTVSVPLTGYTHSFTISGSGVLDGGTVGFSGPGVTQLGPVSAAILTP
jgi:hypothetical protein